MFLTQIVGTQFYSVQHLACPMTSSSSIPIVSLTHTIILDANWSEMTMILIVQSHSPGEIIQTVLNIKKNPISVTL